jgi:hypothetical protein
MNVVLRYMKVIYEELIIQYYNSGYWQSISAFRSEMINNYGCSSVQLTRPTRLNHVWQIQVKGTCYIYKYDALKKEIKCVG